MKRSEKRLLAILLSLLVLGGLFISANIYREKRAELLAAKSALDLQWVEIEALFEEKEIWEMRAQWLTQNQPPFTSNEQILTAIFDDSMAENRRGVTITKQTLLPVAETDSYIEAAIDLSATGELGAISRWLYDITRPSSFRALRDISIRPDVEEPENVIAEFQLLRWYAPPES